MTRTAERILEAARDQLLARGIQDFSLRQLARDLGITAPALYRYHGDREALLVAVVERSYGILDDYLFQALKGRDPQDRMARVADGYLRFGLEHPRDFAVVSLLPGAFGVDELHHAIRAREAATFHFWVDRVREATGAGVLDTPGTPEELAGLLWAAARGLLDLHHRGLLPVEDDQAFSTLFWRTGTWMMQGLAGPGWSATDLPVSPPAPRWPP